MDSRDMLTGALIALSTTAGRATQQLTDETDDIVIGGVAACCGDAPNDAEMLDTVGFGYMMANAVPEMREHARYVAPSNEDRGVLTVMDQIVAARRAMLDA